MMPEVYEDNVLTAKYRTHTQMTEDRGDQPPSHYKNM